MDKTNDPNKADATNENNELSEEALDQVSGGLRKLPFTRKDIEREGDSLLDPRVVRKPAQIVDL